MEIEPVPFGTGSVVLAPIPPLLHSKDQVIVIVKGARRTRGRGSLIAELRPNGLQAAGGKRERPGNGLGAHNRRSNRPDQSPRWTVCVGCEVEVEVVLRRCGPCPNRRGDRCRVALRHRTAVCTGYYDAVARLVGVECSRVAVGAIAVDGVGTVYFVSTAHRAAPQEQGCSRVAGRTHGCAFRRFQCGVKDSVLWTSASRRSHGQGNRRVVAERPR
jgi:hypothetical protein